jgi:hypothetical protein
MTDHPVAENSSSSSIPHLPAYGHEIAPARRHVLGTSPSDLCRGEDPGREQKCHIEKETKTARQRDSQITHLGIKHSEVGPHLFNEQRLLGGLQEVATAFARTASCNAIPMTTIGPPSWGSVAARRKKRSIGVQLSLL